MKDLAIIRKPVPSDAEFLLKTWLREHRRSVPLKFPDRLYYNEYQEKVILPLMRKSEARVVVSRTDPNYIMGFVIAEVYPDGKTAVVHFAYMRPPFRRAGLLRAALTDLGYQDGYEIVATHWSKYLDRFQLPQLIYNYLVLYGVMP